MIDSNVPSDINSKIGLNSNIGLDSNLNPIANITSKLGLNVYSNYKPDKIILTGDTKIINSVIKLKEFGGWFIPRLKNNLGAGWMISVEAFDDLMKALDAILDVELRRID